MRKSSRKNIDTDNVNGISLRTFSEEEQLPIRNNHTMASSSAKSDVTYQACDPISRHNKVTITCVDSLNNNDDKSTPVISITNSDLKIKSDKSAIRCRNLNLSYKESILSSLKGPSLLPPVFVLNGLNLTVPVGAIYGLLGPSGCGKTSLLRCIMGCQKPESGTIKVFGFDPKNPGSGVPGPGVGFMPQEVALHDDLTICEMISYFGRLGFVEYDDLTAQIDSVINVLQLPPKDRLIATLSGGQKRRVSFACALLHKPRLLILDEPTVGVDPLLRERIWDHLIKLSRSESKTSVIITTHYIEETRRADVVGFMRKGQILAEGEPTSLMAKYNASTLEEVFYKLCTNQKRESLRISLDKSVLSRGTTKKKFTSEDYEDELSKIPYKYSTSSGNSIQRWFKQFHALQCKYWTQILRQPESLVGQFVLPMICLIMFCVCIGGTPSQLPVAVINEEDPPYLSELLIKSINSYILKRVNYTDMELALDDVRKGKIWGVLHIKPNFSETILQRVFFEQDIENAIIEQSNVKLYADLTNKVLGITLDTVLTHTFQDFIHDALIELGYNPALGLYPITIADTIYGEFTKSDFFGVRDFGAPGFLIVVVYSVAYALTALSLLVERIDDMFERNYSTGCSTTQIILAILTTRLTCNIVGVSVLLTMAVYLFDVPCRGSFAQVLLMLILQSLCGMCLGMAVSAVVPDFFICTAVSNGILIFIFIISGVLWSLETLPYYIRWFSYISPTTLPAEAMRSMLTRGLTIEHASVYPGFVITVLWTIVFFFAGVKLFKFQK